MFQASWTKLASSSIPSFYVVYIFFYCFRCGIVSMWMAAKCLLGDSAKIPSIEEIQSRAVELNFSANGEMFRHKNNSNNCSTRSLDLEHFASIGNLATRTKST